MTKVTLKINDEFNFPIIGWEYNMLEESIEVEFSDEFVFLDKDKFVEEFNKGHYSSELANALAFAYIIGGADAFGVTLRSHIEWYYNEFDKFIITKEMQEAELELKLLHEENGFDY